MKDFVPWHSHALRHKLTLSLLTLFAFAAFPDSVNAEEPRDEALERYYTVERVLIEEVPEEEISLSLGELHLPALEAMGLPVPGSGEAPQSHKNGLLQAGLVLDRIINLGQKVWTIVEANRPVVATSSTPANALPQGVNGWYALEGWQAPVRRAWRVRYENLFGWTVVDFTYKLIYTPGGKVNGQGRYLTNVAIIPVNLDVAWGYTFNARGSVPAVTNAGTHDRPVAAAEVRLEWSVDTALKHSQSSRTFYVRGDGHFQELNH